MSKPAIETAKKVFVRDGSDWAVFFYDAQSKLQGYSGVWAAVSSYGEYGHYWSSIGEPFESFVQNVNRDYLLGKICNGVKEFSVEGVSKAVAAELNRRLDAGLLHAPTVNTSLKVVAALANEVTNRDENFLHHLMEDGDPGINSLIEDGFEFGVYEYPFQAQLFADKLWPKFVQAIKS